MKESTFINVFAKSASIVLKPPFLVKVKPNLLYELYLNKKLEVPIKDVKVPKRGNSAFQVDCCIYEAVQNVEFPRLVLEFKTKITTHDILTYSAKAGKHKLIYPVLRYGLVASELAEIPYRFFTHNEHLDFFIAAKDYKTTKLEALCKNLIKSELFISNELEKIYFGNKRFNFYQSFVNLKNLE
ncbi:MAG: hypothetical protein IPG01_00195 [Chitinophagaceae bacterium]|nr:hypothetical protein [Chitinophagaceae bacterium]